MGVALVGLWLVVLSVCDIRARRLPNVLTLPGAALILGVAALTGHGVAALAGAGALAGLYLGVHLLDPAALGAGDVKLALGLGALTGAFGVDVWLLAALGGPLLTGLWAVWAALRGAVTVPHGPSMCLASAAAVGLVLW